MSKIFKKLELIEKGKTFEVGGVEFIKLFDKDGVTVAVTKKLIEFSDFGKNNNFAKSKILKQLNKEFLPKLISDVGEENICEFETDLTSLDGLKDYGTLKSRVSLPTFDLYRDNVETFDNHKVDNWWWLATPDSAAPHWEDCPWVVCVSPSGRIISNICNDNDGVRPLLNFVSSISVSCEE